MENWVESFSFQRPQSRPHDSRGIIWVDSDSSVAVTLSSSPSSPSWPSWPITSITNNTITTNTTATTTIHCHYPSTNYHHQHRRRRHHHHDDIHNLSIMIHQPSTIIIIHNLLVVLPIMIYYQRITTSMDQQSFSRYDHSSTRHHSHDPRSSGNPKASIFPLRWAAVAADVKVIELVPSWAAEMENS